MTHPITPSPNIPEAAVEPLVTALRRWRIGDAIDAELFHALDNYDRAIASSPSPSPEGDLEIARGAVERHRGNLLKPGSVMRLTEAIAAALTRKGEEEIEACAEVAEQWGFSNLEIEELGKGPFTIQDAATKSCCQNIVSAIRARKGGKP